MNDTCIDSALTVAHAPLLPVVSVTTASTIGEAARVAARTGVDLLVVDARPVTVVTRASLAAAIVNGVDPESTVVAVATEPRYASMRQSLADTLRAMAIDRVDSVLVVDDAGRLVGALATADAVATLLAGPQWLGALRVALHIEATS
jgi:predicted transcriptional regulator